MTTNDVLAVIISFNGLEKPRRSVETLRGQVGHIHIVDNASNEDSVQVLDSLEREPDVSVTRLSENRGIGHALNLGVKRAREMNYSWLLTMDQDSVVDGSFIEAYRAAIAANPKRECLVPVIAGDRRGIETEVSPVSYAITSGNLVRVALFDEIGLYDEGLFIDCVDFDFSLRLRRAGHAIYRVPNASMEHYLGEAAVLPGFLRGFYARHSPVRRYYQTRNYLYLAERYLFGFPKFIIKLGLLQITLTLLIGFLDPNPLNSYRAVVRGLKDYFARKQGPYLEPA